MTPNLTSVPTGRAAEIQARFQAWSQTSPLAMAEREKLWAEYVDARDNRPPGTTAKEMGTRAAILAGGLSSQTRLYSVRAHGHL